MPSSSKTLIPHEDPPVVHGVAAHSIIQLVSFIIWQQNCRINYICEAVKMKIYGTPLRRSGLWHRECGVTPGCIRVRLFTDLDEYKKGVIMIRTGHRFVSYHRSKCEADFPMLPDGGLDLKFVKLWWGIKDFKVIDPLRWTQFTPEDVLSPLAVNVLSEGTNNIHILYDIAHPTPPRHLHRPHPLPHFLPPHNPQPQTHLPPPSMAQQLLAARPFLLLAHGVHPSRAHSRFGPDAGALEGVRKRMWVEKVVAGGVYERWEEHHGDGGDEDDEDEEAEWGIYEGRERRTPVITWEQRLKALQWGYYADKIWPLVLGICATFWSVSFSRQVWDATEGGRMFVMVWSVKLWSMADEYCGDEVRREVARFAVGVEGFLRDDRVWRVLSFGGRIVVMVIVIRVFLRPGVAIRK